MSKIVFKNLEFEIENEKIALTDFLNYKNIKSRFAEVNVSGENKMGTGSKMVHSSEYAKFKYAEHNEEGNTLTVVQKSKLVSVATKFTAYDSTETLRIETSVKNISSSPIVLEEVSSFVFEGIPFESFFTRFVQSHHKECQPFKRSFAEWGLNDFIPIMQKKISFANIGSWSTKEELPQGIIENEKGALMFQIESSNSWYYEISNINDYYLYLGGANLSFGNWSCKLEPQESYDAPAVAIAMASSVNDVIGEMTKYRRLMAKRSECDKNLPTIFNEYMHLSWDSPTAENTKKVAPVVAKSGCEYYVIDCGWHNEEDGRIIYPYVGHWKESKARFPEGVKKTTDYISSLGLKPGLWIEPEIIGNRCTEMLEYYDEDCFFQRFGRKIERFNRHFLDYRNPKVREYMTETIRRMVEDYGAQYIKCDYNQDCGAGTDLNAFSFGRGLQLCNEAYLEWIKEMQERFPNVIFEACAGGGLRMDNKTLSNFSLASTSDQIDYKKYPYIAGNILSAVIPEQAAVWSYPVTEELKGEEVSNDRIAMNMINSFLGRMHLASHLERLNDEQMDLIKEGIDYYNSLTEAKKVALPYFPNGFTHFGDDSVASGLKLDSKVYLAVWNLSNNNKVQVNIPNVKECKIAYPSDSDAEIEITKNELYINFPRRDMAVFLEIEVK